MDDYDPSHPAIVFTVFKWYMDPEVVGQMLIEQYPHKSVPRFTRTWKCCSFKLLSPI